MGKIFLGFVAATLLEIFVFIEVGSAIGAWNTIGLILLSAIVGVSLVRVQGLKMLLEAQRKMQLGEPPAREMLGGTLIALSGALLILPGFVSDLIGLLLLLPPVRQAIVARLLSKVKMQTSQSGHTFSGEFYRTDGTEPLPRLDPFSDENQPDNPLDDKQGTTFEGDFERKDDK